MRESLRSLFERLTPPQRWTLLGLVALVTALSIFGWLANRRPDVRAQFPEWVFDGMVMFDGYGNYADAILRAVRDPSPENREYLLGFLRGHGHADRFVYPAFTAAVALVVGSIPISGVIVAVGFSLLTLLAFNRLAVRHLDLRGPDLLWIHALFLTHLGIIGAWARPMAEPLALYFLLAAIHHSAVLRERRSAASIAKLVVLIGLASYTKAVLVLAALMPAAAIVLAVTRTRGQLLLGALLCLAVPPALLALYQAALLFLGREAAHYAFYRQALATLPHIPWTDPAFQSFVVTAGGLMVLLALQIYPLFLVFPRGGNPLAFRWRDPRWTLHALWIGAYLAQRVLFSGFSLGHSRARYGVPLVPSMILLAYPGLRALRERFGWGRWVPPAIALGNLAVWFLFHMRAAAGG